MNLVAGEWIVGMEGEKRLEIVAVGDGVLPAFRRSTFTPTLLQGGQAPVRFIISAFPCVCFCHTLSQQALISSSTEKQKKHSKCL